MNTKNTTKGSKQRPTPSKKNHPGITTSAEQIEHMMDLLKPMIDFQKAAESASDNDLRLSWDVNVTRGNDTPFKRLRGASTMPALFSPKMLLRATSTIENGLIQKILIPLVEAVEEEVDPMISKLLEKHAKACEPSGEDESRDDQPEPSADAEL